MHASSSTSTSPNNKRQDTKQSTSNHNDNEKDKIQVNTSSSRNHFLEPPTFKLPHDFHSNPSNYELWSVRVPISFDLTALHDQKLSILLTENSNKQKTSSHHDTVLSNFKLGNEKFSFIVGHESENSHFRLLTAKDQNDNNNDENEEEEEESSTRMYPSPYVFTKHLNLISSSYADKTDVDFAPSIDRAPKVDLDSSNNNSSKHTRNQNMRVAYEHIDQVQGLKRRWNSFGSQGGLEAYQNRQKELEEEAKQLRESVSNIGSGHKEKGKKQKTKSSEESLTSSPKKKKEKKSK